MKNITMRIYWDDQQGVAPGWYVSLKRNGEVICDSVKLWFPVDVEQYGQDDLDELVNELQVHYPDANVSCDFNQETRMSR